jgi:hypothetical protein
MGVFEWITFVAVIMIALVYAYRTRKQSVTGLQKTHRRDWYDQIIDELHRLRSNPQSDLDWALSFLEADETTRNGSRTKEQFLDIACSEYLVATSEKREAIRRLFIKDSWWPLLEYASARSVSTTAPSGVNSLRLGLAACSIAGLRIDFRDLLICLGELCQKAEAAGIDPLPYFKEIGDLSDTEMDGSASTASLIGGFQETAYYKSLERPRKDQVVERTEPRGD